MPFIGCWLSGISLSQLDVNFVNFWLWLNLADAVNLAISRSIVLRVLARRKKSGVMCLALISNLPCLALLSAKFSWIAAFSPSAALVGLTVGVLEGKPISLTLPLLRLQLAIHPIPLIATFLMPTILRASLLWTAWSVWRSLPAFKESGASEIFERIQPALQKFNCIAEWIFLFPALERRVRERTDNPVLRHFLTVTRWRFTWQPYLLAFIAGWLLPSPFGFVSLFLSYFVIWLATYEAVHNYLRKLHRTGELWMWLITPMKSETIVQGWIEGSWWWKARWGSLILWGFIGNIIGHGFPFSFVGWIDLSCVIGTLAVLALPYDRFINLAIADVLEHPAEAFSEHRRMWSFLKAMDHFVFPLLIFVLAVTIFSLAPIAPLGFVLFGFLMLILVAFALTREEKVNIGFLAPLLDEIRKAPMEKLPVQ